MGDYDWLVDLAEAYATSYAAKKSAKSREKASKEAAKPRASVRVKNPWGGKGFEDLTRLLLQGGMNTMKTNLGKMGRDDGGIADQVIAMMLGKQPAGMETSIFSRGIPELTQIVQNVPSTVQQTTAPSVPSTAPAEKKKKKKKWYDVF